MFAFYSSSLSLFSVSRSSLRQIRKEDDESGVAKDWKYAAMVVDRLCLIIFTFFTIAATIAVLMSAPHIIVS
jgi:nicotinic acetylcholine receptor, invertebrate